MAAASGKKGERDWLGELNPPQKEAATAGDGPVLVIAGAGTGKTKTLACRVAHLVSQGVDPGRIMLLTFTRRAAEEMLRRADAMLREAMSPGGSDRRRGQATSRVWGGTFHSVANRLLRKYGKAIGLDPDFTVMDQTDSEDLLNVVRQQRGFAEKKKRFPKKRTCHSIYSRCVNSSDPLDYTLRTYFPWCQDWEEELKELFKTYVDVKQDRNVLDYDDLLLFWYHLLGDAEIAATIEAQFDHVLVDEYQDTNRLQAGILERMRRENRNITVVGDDAQSIYSFRAAEVRNILEFPTLFQGSRMIALEQNYRSRQPILDATNSVIGFARHRYTKDLWSNRGGEQKPLLVTCEREEDQTDYVVDGILRHYEEGIPLRRQAVLFRIGYWSDHLEVELTRRNIPYHKYGGLKFLEAAHVKDLLAFLRVLENPRDQIAWSRVLNLLEGVGPTTAARCYEHVASRGYDPRSIGEMKVPTPAREGIGKVAELFGHLLGAERRLSISGEVERIRRFYNPIFEATYDNPEPRRRDLEQLEQIAAGYRSRERFLTELTLDPPSSTVDYAGPPLLDEDWLTLSTIHSAKGCEWDVVFVIHVTDGILPSDMTTGDPDLIEEERRLLYVACTRARERLYVLHPLRYYVKRGSLGDAHGYAQLTRFIPPESLPLFEQVGYGSEHEPDEPASELSTADIREKIRSMWG